MCGGDHAHSGREVETDGKKPFTIRQLNGSTYLIRENDGYGEFPHVYAKICSSVTVDGSSVSVILLSDTGVGTRVPRNDGSEGVWTLRSFLEENINPDERLPYLILLSHCHWDHILGLKHWFPVPDSENHHDRNAVSSPERQNNPTIVASSHDKAFLNTYSALNTNSLCEREGLPAPDVKVDIWADHNTPLTYTHPYSGTEIDLRIICLHTPGHTPDSLSWYDIRERTLYTDDHLYQRESEDTRTAPWAPERPCPIVFPLEGDLREWWQSNKMLASFVEEENLRLQRLQERSERVVRVKLAAGHVTAGDVDAYECIVGAGDFVARVLNGEVPSESLPFEDRGEEMRHWTWKLKGSGEDVEAGEFSVGAPVRVVEEGRRGLREGEWKLE